MQLIFPLRVCNLDIIAIFIKALNKFEAGQKPDDVSKQEKLKHKEDCWRNTYFKTPGCNNLWC